MKNLYLVIPLLLALVIVLFLACKKEEFPKKSYVSIEDVEMKVNSEKIDIYFTIEGNLANDPVVKKSVELYNVNSLIEDTSFQGSYPIQLDIDSVTITGLLADSTYCFRIIIETDNNESEPASNKFYYPNEMGMVCFSTPKVTINTAKIGQEFPSTLRLKVEGKFEELDNSTRMRLTSFGHIWYELSDNSDNPDTLRKRVIVADINQLNLDGSYSTEFSFYDLNKFYNTRAFYLLSDATDTIFSTNTTITYIPTSDGNYWVNMAALPEYRNAPPPREGAISFSIITNSGKEYGYIGAGKSNEKNGDGTPLYLTDLWKYDPEINQWSQVCETCIKERMHGQSFQYDKKLYVGLGCDKCPEDKNDFTYNKFNFGDANFLKDFQIFNISDNGDLFPTNTSIYITHDSQNYPIDTSSRGSAYIFKIGTDIYLGGGIGASVLEGDLNGDMDISDREWIDFNRNGKIDRYVDINEGEWVDGGVVGLFEVGEWTDFNGNGILDIGEWVDSGPMPDGYLNAGNWTDSTGNGKVDFDMGEWDSQAAANEIETIFHMGEWLLDTTINKTGQVSTKQEWIDNLNPDQPDSNEFTYKLSTRSDLFKFNGSQFDPQLTNALGAKYGSVILEQTDKAILLHGGTLPNNPILNDQIYVSGGSVWSKSENKKNSDLVSIRNYPVSFKIGNDFYIGAGEKISNNNSFSVGFDLWMLPNSNETEDFISRQGCGLDGLTRGISFSLNGRGYAGFGKVGIGPPESLTTSNEFWMYIPKK